MLGAFELFVWSEIVVDAVAVCDAQGNTIAQAIASGGTV
jgi:hypothetical protein